MFSFVTMYAIKGLPNINKGDDLVKLVLRVMKAQQFNLEEGDIIVIAQKIISKMEGSVVDLQTVTPTLYANELAEKTGRDPRLVQVFLNESQKVIRVKGRTIVTKHILGFECSSAGVDKSNVANKEDERVVLLPRNPDHSANLIKYQIYRRTRKNVAVIINDSFGRPDRDGSVGVAIGIAGIGHLKIDSTKDIYDNPINSRIALVDELAAAASILMGQGSERIPVVVIRGVHYEIEEHASIQNLLLDTEFLGG